MNILFLFHTEITPHNGGVQRVTDILAKEMAHRGHHVFFVSTSKSEQKYDDYSGIQEYALGYNEDKNKFLQQYTSILKKHKIDIVVNQEATEKSLFLLENTPEGIKKITAFHGRPFPFVNCERRVKKALRTTNFSQILFKYFCILFPSVYRKYHIKQNASIIRRAVLCSDKICLLSSHFFSHLKKYINIDDDKLVAINNPNTFSELSALVIKENVVLYVGRLCETPKNVCDFISVWHILQQKNPEWRAEIVGDGPDRKRLESYAQKIGCQRLSFEGSKKNVKDYYAKARFVCLTSMNEGWGMVLTEGMAYGCIPCAYGTYESVHDIIDNDECGFVTIPFSPMSMAEKIQSLIDNPQRMEGFSQRAKEKVGQFSVEHIVDQWEHLFCEMVK